MHSMHTNIQLIECEIPMKHHFIRCILRTVRITPILLVFEPNEWRKKILLKLVFDTHGMRNLR